jgi:hypothetical protein
MAVRATGTTAVHLRELLPRFGDGRLAAAELAQVLAVGKIWKQSAPRHVDFVVSVCGGLGVYVVAGHVFFPPS